MWNHEKYPTKYLACNYGLPNFNSGFILYFLPSERLLMVWPLWLDYDSNGVASHNKTHHILR